MGDQEQLIPPTQQMRSVNVTTPPCTGSPTFDTTDTVRAVGNAVPTGVDWLAPAVTLKTKP